MDPRLHGNTVAARATCAILAVLAGLVISCTPRTRRTPDDTVVLVIEAAMTTADPRAQVTSYDNKLAHLVASGLTAVDTPTMIPRLDLASKIETVDPLTIDVTLRDDARFSDGLPVRAADVVGTYATVLDPASTSASHKFMSDRIASVEERAPRIARFHLKTPLATFLSDVDFGIVSFHHGTPRSDAVIGSGPYMLRALTSTGARLEANPYYYGGAPKVANVQIKFVRDAAARLLMLVGGSADLIQNAIRPDLVAAMRSRPRVHVETAGGVILTYLMMNNLDPVLAKREVRQAIALALDRPTIIAAKLGGLATLATGLLAPSHWAYSGDVPRYDHDLARARRLLDEAGLPDPDGDGPAPRIRFVYKTSADTFRIAIARVIAAQLAEVGIAVEIRSFEFATFFGDIKKGQYQLASMQTTDITDPDFYFMYFHSSWIPTKTNPDGFNRWRYRNAEVDRLTAAGREVLDRAARKQVYAEVQRLVAEDVPVVPLWHEDNIILSNVDVQGYTTSPNARLAGLTQIIKQP
ncbi:MAG: ABC transporter substrate-binding protein [Myxococcales bacterium]|nr:ABC transporter substrate-binding protein [Myxococcales bacterium]